MISPLNPWFALGLLILIAGAGATGYVKGSKHAHDADRAAHATALESAVKEANERAAVDAQALVAQERKRQQVRTVFVDKVKTITETIYANPTNCTVHPDYRLRVNELITSANTPPVAIDGVLPAPAPAGK